MYELIGDQFLIILTGEDFQEDFVEHSRDQKSQLNHDPGTKFYKWIQVSNAIPEGYSIKSVLNENRKYVLNENCNFLGNFNENLFVVLIENHNPVL